ncbi:MAG: PASTA domain-containing protein [Clostridia bacterium]|nr:PASTA domain-containing protein [Clostridia bacterium]
MKKKTKDSSKNMSKRGKSVLAIVIAVGVLLIGRLVYLQIIQGEYYSAKVDSQQSGSIEIKAERGKIYDANMNVLAQSASVWKVYLNPSKINNFKEEERDEIRTAIASGLAAILDMSEETILGYTQKNYSYQSVKGGIEKETRDEVLELIEYYKTLEENPIDLSEIICIETDVKRYYPHDSLASTVIGFTGSDGIGRSGIEYHYDELLTGVSGKTVTALDGNGNAMPNQYETVYEAQEGTGLVLTIDMYVQYILEDVLSGAYEDTGAENVYGIVMDVKTGAILAMASFPDYDLNDPYTIKSEALYAAYQEASAQEIKREDYETDAAYENAKYLASAQFFRDQQWNNRAVTSSYEPGSVYKVVTAAAALEEGVATLETSHYCSGIIKFATRNIKCWKAGGHGSETFADLLKNSCNPFAVTLANEIGRDTFYDYFEAFGLTEKTGIDTAGETTPKAGVLYKTRDDFSLSDLASYSFGQSFQVSPLQMITAISAVANGGKLMTPYIVSKQVDEDLNVISETVPTVKRQVVSESTADTICEIMREVVASGTGKNANAEGYRVAGKTGTSQKLTSKDEDLYIASFCGFAPADDPEVSLIIIVDEPDGEHGGGTVAAPLARAVFEQVLPYLGIEKAYTDEEASRLVDKAPNLIGKSVADAKSAVSSTSLTLKVVGEGDTVVSQYPDSGREIPADGIIVVYTEDDTLTSTVTVPDFTGCTVSQANRLAINSGLNIKISGSSLDTNSAYAYAQSIEAGTETRYGEIITVSFKTSVNVGD